MYSPYGLGTWDASSHRCVKVWSRACEMHGFCQVRGDHVWRVHDGSRWSLGKHHGAWEPCSARPLLAVRTPPTAPVRLPEHNPGVFHCQVAAMRSNTPSACGIPAAPCGRRVAACETVTGDEALARRAVAPEAVRHSPALASWLSHLARWPCSWYMRCMETTHAYQRDEHRVHRISYHLIWCPRRRKPVLVGPVAARCRELIEGQCAEKGWQRPCSSRSVGPPSPLRARLAE